MSIFSKRLNISESSSPALSPGHAFFPWLTVWEKGKIFVMYYVKQPTRGGGFTCSGHLHTVQWGKLHVQTLLLSSDRLLFPATSWIELEPRGARLTQPLKVSLAGHWGGVEGGEWIWRGKQSLTITAPMMTAWRWALWSQWSSKKFNLVLNLAYWSCR